MKSKKWLIVLAIAIIAIIIIFIIFKGGKNNNEKNNTLNNVTILGGENAADTEFVNIEQDGTKVNKSEKFATTKKIEGLEISNIKLTEKGNLTQILADVKNTTDKKVEGFYVTITFLNKDGDMIVGIGGYIPTVEANGTATLNTNSTGDFANAYDYTITRSEVE